MNDTVRPGTKGASPSAHEARVRQWNATARSYPREAGLAELFARWSRRTPDARAVIDGDHSLSYRELDQRANALAHTLAGRGIQPGHRIGLLGRRSAESVIAILGIIKTGAAYVPLDTEYPAKRLTAMAEDSGLSAVVVPHRDSTHLAEFLGHQVPVLHLDDRLMPDFTQSGAGHALAYVMFTSGSTGPPKAVGVRQRGVTRLVTDTDYITLGPDDRVLHVSSLSFDASTFEIWGALLNGACLVVADSPILLSPEDLRRLLRTHAITTAFVTTAVFHRLAHQTPDIFGQLRNVAVGGDTLSPDSVRRVLASSSPPRRLINGYGPTENTTFTTAYLVRSLPESATAVPIGRPIANTTCYILRDDGTLADVGERGELFAGGDGVALGYLNDAGLTAERFIPDPFSDDPSSRLYRTGDIATWREDGTIDHHGRRDAQFKLHGYRIEAGEIENTLLRHPGIAGAVVTRRDVPATGGASDAQMIAYIVPAGDQTPAATELREHLGKTLPSFMFPAHFVPLEQLPLSPNGKIDRMALPVPAVPDSLPGSSAAASQGPREDIQDQVRLIWSEVLRARGIDGAIEPEDTLFDIGGTSFDVAEVHARVSAQSNAPDLTPLDLFTYPTLRGYAEHLASLLSATSSETDPPPPR
jgi:amino acid adenylation domain-containing protein